jgi:hypothetical protein
VLHKTCGSNGFTLHCLQGFHAKLRGVSAPVREIPTAETPILDRLTPLPKLAKARWLGSDYESLVGLVVVYGLFFTFFALPTSILDPLLRWASRNLQALFLHDWVGVKVLITIVLILAAICGTVVVHELGHVVVGLMAGFRFRYMRLGKFEVNPSLRFSRSRVANESVLGMACFFPIEMKHHPWKFVAMIASGPLANLISGFLLLLLPYQKSFASGAFIATSLFLGANNLIPFRGKNFRSDGLQILSVLFQRSKHERALSLEQLRDELESGVDVEALSPDLIAELTAVHDNSPATLVANAVAYTRAYYQKDNSAAACYLETCLLFSGKGTPQIRNSLIADATIFQALRRKRPDLAQQWLDDLPADPRLKSVRLRAEGAIAEARGNFAQAIGKVEACLQEAEKMENERSRKRLISKLAEWKVELDKCLVQSDGS